MLSLMYDKVLIGSTYPKQISSSYENIISSRCAAVILIQKQNTLFLAYFDPINMFLSCIWSNVWGIYRCNGVNKITDVQEETDYLLDLCERLDLRFIIISDRWNFPGGPKRTVEDLKERYYSIAHQLLVARHGSVELVANNPLIRQTFEAQKERERKELLRMSLTRTQQEVQHTLQR